MAGKKAKVVDDPEHWRRRAAEARALADVEGDPKVRHRLRGIAKSYEDVADLVEERARAAAKAKPGDT